MVAAAGESLGVAADAAVRLVEVVNKHRHAPGWPCLLGTKRPAIGSNFPRQGTPVTAGIFRSHMLEKVTVKLDRELEGARRVTRHGHVVRVGVEHGHGAFLGQPAQFLAPDIDPSRLNDNEEVIILDQGVRKFDVALPEELAFDLFPGEDRLEWSSPIEWPLRRASASGSGFFTQNGNTV